MYIDMLKPGTKVLLQKRGDGPGEGVSTRVDHLGPDGKTVFVYALSDGRGLYRFDKGETYFLRLLTSRSTFRYKVNFEDYDSIDGIKLVKFKLLDEGEKIQRRAAFRFTCAQPVSFTVIYTSGSQSEPEEGLLIDLSAGGAKIYTNKDMNISYLINITLDLDDELVIAFGDVRMKEKLPIKSKYAYQYGIRFAMMPESDQEKIIRYMYKKHREELAKASSRQGLRS